MADDEENNDFEKYRQQFGSIMPATNLQMSLVMGLGKPPTIEIRGFPQSVGGKELEFFLGARDTILSLIDTAEIYFTNSQQNGIDARFLADAISSCHKKSDKDVKELKRVLKEQYPGIDWKELFADAMPSFTDKKYPSAEEVQAFNETRTSEDEMERDRAAVEGSTFIPGETNIDLSDEEDEHTASAS